jgi:hypothetical protein
MQYLEQNILTLVVAVCIKKNLAKRPNLDLKTPTLNQPGNANLAQDGDVKLLEVSIVLHHAVVDVDELKMNLFCLIPIH